jgi:CheY-like chemotaxis protein
MSTFHILSGKLFPELADMATILAVDDDLDDLEFLETVIQEIDSAIIIVKAHDGKQALSLLGTIQPDFIFLDINMPIMNGLDCLKMIRTDPRFDRTPITIISTSMNKHDMLRCVKLNSGFITKPSSYVELRD